MPRQDTPALIRALTEAGVRFIIVGGVAAIVHGASTFTRDLDLLASFDEENMARLLSALGDHAPRFALHPAHPKLTQGPTELAQFKNLYLETDLGRVDVLGRIPNGTYAELAPKTVKLSLAGVACAVLDLDELIDSKAQLGRPKDEAALIELRAIRDRLSSERE